MLMVDFFFFFFVSCRSNHWNFFRKITLSQFWYYFKILTVELPDDDLHSVLQGDDVTLRRFCRICHDVYALSVRGVASSPG